MSFPLRLHELLRHPDHTLLLWAADEAPATAARQIATELPERTSGRVRSHILVPAGVAAGDASGSALQDTDGQVAGAYGFDRPVGEPRCLPTSSARTATSPTGPRPWTSITSSSTWRGPW